MNTSVTPNSLINVCLIAYDISPYRGSEASVAWNFVSHMSKYVNLTVVYGWYKDDIDRYIKENGPIANVRFVLIPTEDLSKYGGTIMWDIHNIFQYKKWHKTASNIIAEMAEAGEFDLIHYLNPIGFKEPGYAWKVKSIPFVWGPIMAVENRPFSLYKAFSFKVKCVMLARRIIHNSMFLLSPRVRKAFRRVDAFFAATPNSARMLDKYYHRKAVHMPENAILRMDTTEPIIYNAGETLNIIWIGRVADEGKGLVILLDALLKAKSENWCLHVVGGGQVKPAIAERIKPIENRITWHGLLPRDRVQTLIRDAHLHVISSLGEATTTVIWEAMSKAVPTMTLDHCGMSAVVCEKCGIKIPIEKYDKVTDRIAHELDRLISNPQEIGRMSAGVLECAKNFMWDEKRCNRFLDVYNQLLKDSKS